MADQNTYGAAENGTYSTDSPNPHIDLAGTSPTGFLIAQLFGGALTNGQTATVTIAKAADAGVWAVYSGVTYTTGTPNIIDLTGATLKESAGSLANTDSVVCLGLAPFEHTQAETTITFTDVTTGNASTTAHGFAPKAVAPAAGLLNVLGIANGETAYSMKGAEPAANITTAARTVLDDATVGDMVNTLGGATATGTGGLARATSPTFVTPILGTPTSGTLTNCTGYPAATTSAAGLLHAVTAPASGSLNVSGIANGETVHTEKTIFDGLLQVRVLTEAAYQALGAGRPATTLYIRT
jgi:hypothetical protein